jgi:beta-lactamase class A
MITRRQFTITAALSAAATAAVPRRALADISTAAAFTRDIDAMEKESGGRFGVYALEPVTGLTLSNRPNERFPMCSTFKFLAAAAILARVDQGKESLSRVVHYTKEELFTYAPVTTAHVEDGLSLAEICAAAVTMSDNTAANLMLAALDGPAGVTAFCRTIGDNVTRLDRTELSLNTCIPGDPRDTSSPAAIATNLRTLVTGNALSPDSRKQLTQWLLDCKTGDTRLRAAVPSTWRVGDKTGTGSRNTANDAAVLWPPSGPPIFAAVYLTDTHLTPDALNAAIAAIGKRIMAALGR